MAKTVVIDELHVTVRIFNDLPDTQTEDIRRTLAGDEFTNRLRRAIRSVLRAYPELHVVRVSVTR